MFFLFFGEQYFYWNMKRKKNWWWVIFPRFMFQKVYLNQITLQEKGPVSGKRKMVGFAASGELKGRKNDSTGFHHKQSYWNNYETYHPHHGFSYTTFPSHNSSSPIFCTYLIDIAYCSWFYPLPHYPYQQFGMEETALSLLKFWERRKIPLLLFGEWPCVVPKPLRCRTIQ